MNAWRAVFKKTDPLAATGPAVTAARKNGWYTRLKKRFMNTKIQHKLFIAFGGLISILVFISIFFGAQLYQVDKKYSELITSTIGRQSNIAGAVSDMDQLYYINLSKGYLATIGAGANEMGALHTNYRQYTESLMIHLDNYSNILQGETSLTDAEKQERLRIVNETIFLFDYNYQPIIERLDAALATDLPETYRTIGESMHIGEQITQRMNLLYNWVSQTAEDISDKTTTHSQQTILLLLSMVTFFVFLSVIISLSVIKIINAPIIQMKNAMLEISKGDLTYPIRSDRNDELGILSNRIGDMVDNLHKAQVELRFALNAAEDSSKIKSEFLDNISHELRTPMNGILGFHRMAMQTNMTEEQRDYITQADNSAKNLLSIINDMLDFSEIIDNKMMVDAKQFKLSDVFNEIYDSYAPAVKSKNLEFYMHLPSDLPERIIGDPHILIKILSNLIDNAVKFTEKGKITMRAGIEKQTDKHIDIRFYVRDTGIGIRPEQMKLLFDLFWQADTSLTRKYNGIGLGLPLSKQLATLQNGKIWAESEYEEGSTFYFTAHFVLPCDLDSSTDNKKAARAPSGGAALDEAALDETALDAAALDEAALDKAALDKAALDEISINEAPLGEVSDKQPHAPSHSHLLIVDDIEINQIIAEELLMSIGYTVDKASNGQEAIDMLAMNEYDAILMDIQMPVMDGLTATTKIREMDKYRDLPIIAVSAHVMDEDIEKSLAHGMNEYVTKPLDPESLIATLDKWLTRGI